MTEQTDTLQGAVEELNSVASELREVRKRAEQYGQSTARLKEVSAALDSLAKAVTAIQGQFQGLLTRAESVLVEAEKARAVASETLKVVPDVVSRIEATDVAHSVGEISRSLESVNNRIGEQLTAVDNLVAESARERADQRQIVDGMASNVSRLAKTVDEVLSGLSGLRGEQSSHVGAINASKESADKAASAAMVFGDKSVKAFAELNKKVDLIRQMLEEHGSKLDEIKSKRGIHF